MKSSNGGRAGRVEKRAVKTMGRAQKNWTKAEAIRKTTPNSEKSSNFAQDEFGRTAAAKADQLYSRANRQEAKAKRQMEKADYLKAKKTGSSVGKMAGSVASASASSKPKTKKG